jgi:hypothetical protein
MSIEIRNFTPFANMRFSNWDAQGREFGVFMVKTAWDILEDGSCRLSDEQEPFALSDQPFPDGGTRYASDLVPWKPATDLILNATAFAPGGRTSTGWEVRATLAEGSTGAVLIDRRVTVSGPRAWQRRLGAWRLAGASAVGRVDLRYENTFGGLVETGTDDDGAPVLEAFERNPVGLGYAREGHLPGDAILAEPMLTQGGETRRSPFQTLSPTGFGPVPAAWLPRRPLGGTYDQDWLEAVWPRWPTDYDFAFHNAASEGMTCQLPQGAGVVIGLTNMHPTRPEWTIRLPRPPVVAHLGTDAEIFASALATDTIFLDIAEDRLSDPRVFQVSRLVFDLTRVRAIVLGPLPEDADDTRLARPPKPDEVARFVEEAAEDDPMPEEALS